MAWLADRAEQATQGSSRGSAYARVQTKLLIEPDRCACRSPRSAAKACLLHVLRCEVKY